MIEAYKKFWKGYVDFKGRSTRSDYWLAVLANTIVTIILFSIVIVVIVFDSPDSPCLLYTSQPATVTVTMK